MHMGAYLLLLEQEQFPRLQYAVMYGSMKDLEFSSKVLNYLV